MNGDFGNPFNAADFFAVIGLDDMMTPFSQSRMFTMDVYHPLEMRFAPRVLDQYPPGDTAPRGLENTFPKGVELFAFPHGLQLK